MLARAQVMLRAKLPWLFTALAVASPPLLLWYIVGSGRDDHDDGAAVIGLYIAWPVVSTICLSVFATLAALTWKSVAVESRNRRRVLLFMFGGLSLLVGCALVLFAVTVTKSMGGTPLGTAIFLGTLAVLFGVGYLALRDLFSTNARRAHGSGDGHAR